jgi:hypothetical protein
MRRIQKTTSSSSRSFSLLSEFFSRSIVDGGGGVAVMIYDSFPSERKKKFQFKPELQKPKQKI